MKKNIFLAEYYVNNDICIESRIEADDYDEADKIAEKLGVNVYGRLKQ